MPELPEVETIIRELKKIIINKKIVEIKVHEAMVIGYPDNEQRFIDDLKGQKIINISRRGKYIVMSLDREMKLVIHLRMSGKLLIKDSSQKYNKHSHVIFKLNNGQDLRFNTIRKFSRVYLVKNSCMENAGGLVNLGPEPLSDNFTLKDFKSLFKGRRAFIKSLLLNQKFLAGMGNIYTDEALFRAGIKPDRKANTLTDKKISALYSAIKEVLRDGINYGGTSFSDYVNTMGHEGDFQKQLMVYQREGEDCLKCGCKIVKDKLCGRSTHYCPHCQI